MMMPFDREELADAAFYSTEEFAADGMGRRRFLQRLLARAAVVVCILIVLVWCRAAGPAGRWTLARIKAATDVDFSPGISAYFSASGWRRAVSSVKSWFKREISVTTGQLKTSDESCRLVYPTAQPVTMSRSGLSLRFRTSGGSPVFAAADGIVAEIKLETDGGRMLAIDHKQGWRTVYGGCDRIAVAIGTNVKAGQIVAYTRTSTAAGPSGIRFELWGPDGQMDPSGFFGTTADAGLI